MDIENKRNKNEGESALGFDDDHGNTLEVLKLPVPTSHPSRDPFPDTPTMAGQRRMNQSKNQTSVAVGISTLHYKEEVSNVQTSLPKTKNNDMGQYHYDNKSTLIESGILMEKQIITGRNMTMMVNTVKQQALAVEIEQVETIHPGAVPMYPQGIAGPTPIPNDTLVHENIQTLMPTTIAIRVIETAFEPTQNAFLLNDNSGLLVSATLLDIEADQKLRRQQRKMTMLSSLIFASMIAVAVAVPVLLTRPGPPPATFSPTFSPVPSKAPSWIPTLSPSMASSGRCPGVCPVGSNLTWPDRIINTTTCEDLDLLAKGVYDYQECENFKMSATSCGCSGYNLICSSICANGKNLLYPDRIPPGYGNFTCRYIDEVFLQSIDDESVCDIILVSVRFFCVCETEYPTAAPMM